MDIDLKWVAVPARILMSLLFLLSAFSKLAAVAGTQAYMEANGIPGVLLWPTAAWEIFAGASLVLGLWPRPVCLALSIWCLVSAVIFHRAWGDQMQFVQFLKNVTMAGAFLMFAAYGLPGWSIRAAKQSPSTPL